MFLLAEKPNLGRFVLQILIVNQIEIEGLLKIEKDVIMF